MSDQLPNDSDGDALRRLAATGSDLTKEMQVDFAVDVADREMGFAFAVAAASLGFQTEVQQDEESSKWTCYCSRTMVPTYDAMISTQRTLEKIGQPYGATLDGWGSFGNAPD